MDAQVPIKHKITKSIFNADFNLVTVVCLDIDECLANICGQYGSCTNTIGSYVCNCNEGFHIQSDATPVCQGLYYYLCHVFGRKILLCV